MRQLVEKKELEKQRVDLELQRKFLEEQQRPFNATVAEKTRSRVSRCTAQNRVSEWLNSTEEGAVGGILVPPAACQTEFGTPAGLPDLFKDKSKQPLEKPREPPKPAPRIVTDAVKLQ